jgi:hypothetical protein
LGAGKRARRIEIRATYGDIWTEAGLTAKEEFFSMSLVSRLISAFDRAWKPIIDAKHHPVKRKLSNF